MAERLTREEFRNYWCGHTLDDACQMRPVPNILGAGFDFARQLHLHPELITWQASELERAYASLERFLAAVPNEPLDVLSEEGYRLNLLDFPKGTIVRFERESASRDSDTRREKLWRIVAQAKTPQNAFIDYLVGLPGEGELVHQANMTAGFAADRYSQSFLLGQVNHRRYKEKGLPDGVSISSLDSIVRINWFEIWEFGQITREQTRTPGFQPKKIRRSKPK